MKQRIISTYFLAFFLFWTLNAQRIVTLEAENAALFGDLKVKPTGNTTKPGLSGGKYIGDFILDSNSYLQFSDVEIPEEGTYELRVFSMGGGRPLSIKVNQYAKTILTTTESPSWDDAPTATTSTLIYMDKGKNKLTMSCYRDHGPNLDKFEIHKTTQIIPKPELEKIVFISSHADEAEITSLNSNETLSYVNDNDEYTSYEVTGVTSTQITAKCKHPILLTGYLFSAGLTNNTDLSKWELESSKDGQSWTKVTPTSSTDLSGAVLYSITRLSSVAVIKSASARYYRLTAKGENNVEVAEWQLFGMPCIETADNNTFPADITDELDIKAKATGYPIGSTNTDGEFYNLFNRDLRKMYTAANTKQYYVEIELDVPYKLNSYTLTTTNNASDRDPKRWTLNGYNPEIGYVELDRQTEFSFPSRYAAMRFDVESDLGFTKFLLDVEENNGGADSQLLKWQLFGEEHQESGIEIVKDEKYSLLSGKGKVSIVSNEINPIDFQIFNVSGGLVSAGRITNSKQDIYLPQGIYIAKINEEKNTKIVIR